MASGHPGGQLKIFHLCLLVAGHMKIPPKPTWEGGEGFHNIILVIFNNRISIFFLVIYASYCQIQEYCILPYNILPLSLALHVRKEME